MSNCVGYEYLAMRTEENKKQSPRLICGYERQGRDQEDIPRLSCGYRKLREKVIRVRGKPHLNCGIALIPCIKTRKGFVGSSQHEKEQR